MTVTRLSNVFVPEVFLSYTNVDRPERTAFFESGVAVSNAAIVAAYSNGGSTNELPFWNDLDINSEPNIGSDNPASYAVPAAVTSGVQKSRIASLNKSFGTALLAAELAGSNPMQRIAERIGSYWMHQWQRRAIATLQGVIADNIASNGGDMVNNVSAATNAGVGAATLFGTDAFLDAAFTSGDHVDDYSVIAVHSTIYSRMLKNDDIQFRVGSEGGSLSLYKGRAIVVDDSLPFTPAAGAGAGDAAAQYTSFLFGPGLLGYGERIPEKPVDLFEDKMAGDGAGVEALITRKSWVIHPSGMSYTGAGTTLADMRNAANWERVVDRKNIPFAALITNG